MRNNNKIMPKKIPSPEIIENLANACIYNNPKKFIPFLMAKNVKVSSPNKVRFYWFFKEMLYCSKHNTTKGKWKARIENVHFDGEYKVYCLNFYDEVYTNERLSIDIRESTKKEDIFIDIMPF